MNFIELMNFNQIVQSLAGNSASTPMFPNN